MQLPKYTCGQTNTDRLTDKLITNTPHPCQDGLISTTIAVYVCRTIHADGYHLDTGRPIRLSSVSVTLSACVRLSAREMENDLSYHYKSRQT